MSKFLVDDNLRFEFISFLSVEKFDTEEKNTAGLECVDIIAVSADCLYFIEAKDFQNPEAPPAQRMKDFDMLIEAGKSKGERKKDGKVEGRDEAVFRIKIGGKIKDSLLREFAAGKTFAKPVVYLLLINLDRLGASELGRLKEKISGYIPIGLNKSSFSAFTEIKFDVVNAEQLKQYGIICTEKVKA